MAAAVALFAADQGHYVSVLDLTRPFSNLAFLLDVEPAAGLEQLLEASAGTAPDADAVDAVRARRSERVAVYGYRFGPDSIAAPATESVVRLVSELKRRSHLVLIDGIDHPGVRSALLAAADRQVVVLEPTPGGAARGAQLLEGLEAGTAPVVVLNHTRPFTRGSSTRMLRRAGVRARPQVSVSYDPALPAICDRGWPKNQLPKALETSVSALSGLLLSFPGGGTQPQDLKHRNSPLQLAKPPKRSSRKAQPSPRRARLGAWWSRLRSDGPRTA